MTPHSSRARLRRSEPPQARPDGQGRRPRMRELLAERASERRRVEVEARQPARRREASANRIRQEPADHPGGLEAGCVRMLRDPGEPTGQNDFIEMCEYVTVWSAQSKLPRGEVGHITAIMPFRRRVSRIRSSDQALGLPLLRWHLARGSSTPRRRRSGLAGGCPPWCPRRLRRRVRRCARDSVESTAQCSSAGIALMTSHGPAARASMRWAPPAPGQVAGDLVPPLPPGGPFDSAEAVVAEPLRIHPRAASRAEARRSADGPMP